MGFSLMGFRSSLPFGALVVPLARVLLGHSHCIEIKLVVVALREPKNCFVTAAKAAARVDAVAKGPDDSVS